MLVDHDIIFGTLFLDDEHCFLCNDLLTSETRTVEHVIPKWMQRRFNLTNQGISLLNGSHIAYGRLVIPSCKQCNQNFLGPLEDEIARATRIGAQAVKKIDKNRLLAWLIKIEYGMLRRELTLLHDRSNPSVGTIVSQSYINQFNFQHTCLQYLRGLLEFHDCFPASIWVYEVQCPNNPTYHWNFIHRPDEHFIAFQLGKVGIVAALDDGQQIERILPPAMRNILEIPLHPIQHLEFSATVFDRTLSLLKVPQYVLAGNSTSTRVMKVPSFSLGAAFEPWDPQRYAVVFASFFRQLNLDARADDFIDSERGVRTWLEDEDGNPLVIDIRDTPWPL